MFSQFAESSGLLSMKSKDKSLSSTSLTAIYGIFVVLMFVVYHHVAGGARSSFATLSVIVQCLGLALLVLQVKLSRSVKGISAKAMMLEAASFACRLSGTTWRHGYLPVDASGDWLYQAIDVVSLCLSLWLLHSTICTKRASYEELYDVFPINAVAAGCFIVGMLFHADNHDHPLCDSLWMAGLLMSVVAVIPQYSLILRSGGKVDALTSHFMAAMAVGRFLSGLFVWRARKHITCAFWIEDFNHAIIVILGAHLLHLVILGDFFFYYIKSITQHGLNSRLILSESLSV